MHIIRPHPTTEAIAQHFGGAEKARKISTTLAWARALGARLSVARPLPPSVQLPLLLVGKSLETFGAQDLG